MVKGDKQMANYFSKYQGRGGPAIAPGIVQMMGSIGDEYAKGIAALGEGVAEYQKNKAEKGKAEADFENALSRMGSLYGEEPGDYQQVLNAVDSKTMEKIQKGKGTKEDFLSALNSLNTVGESIEDRREDAESARRFEITTDLQRKQQEATAALGHRRITSGETIAKGSWASAEDIAAGGVASREGMQEKDISFRKGEGAADRASSEGMQLTQIASTEKMHGERLAQDKSQFFDKLNQDFFLEMGRQDLTDQEREQRYQIHTESSEQAWNQFQDTLAQKDRHHDAVLTETKRMGDLKVNAVDAERKKEAANAQALLAWVNKAQTVTDHDAMGAAMQITPTADDPWGGMTEEKIQSYMDNPEQFQRQMTASERAMKALQTPNLSEEAAKQIATWANADAGTGGVKFVQHPETGAWVAVGPTGTMSQLPSSRKSATEIRVDYERERDRIKSIENKQDALVEAKKSKLASLQKIIAEGIYDATDEEYKKADADWEDLITEIGGGEKIPEYGRDGKLRN